MQRRGGRKTGRLLGDLAAHRPVGGNGRGDDEAAHPSGERRFDHIVRAVDIVAGLLRIAAAPHAGVAGDVKHRVGVLRQGAQHRVAVGDRAHHQFGTEALQKPHVG